MISNLERYKKDLGSLIEKGKELAAALQRYCFKNDFEESIKKQLGEASKNYLDSLPDFHRAYQPWYSEAKALIKQLLPDRLDDFVRHYEKPKSRKDITLETYRIEDCLLGITVRRGYEKEEVAGPHGAILHFEQQRAILESVKARFESSLFDIRQLVQADLFDSELDAAKELLSQKFARAAGALAGVVLEKHLWQVCDNHSVKVGKKNPGISDLNDLLKENAIIDIPQWRFVQHLGDLRNLCDHNKKAEPTVGQVEDLITGVQKIAKSVF
ncbi:MAG: hypothetical protein AB7G68_19160 [Nitrospiraceae bacterium]